MTSLAVVWADEGELADLHAQAERLGVPVSRVMQEAWRLARATIRARSDLIEAARRARPTPKAALPAPPPTPARPIIPVQIALPPAQDAPAVASLYDWNPGLPTI